MLGELDLILLTRWHGKQAVPYMAELVSSSSSFMIGVVFRGSPLSHASLTFHVNHVSFVQ